CEDPAGTALQAFNFQAAGAQALMCGNDLKLKAPTGVYGESAQQGVVGNSTGDAGNGVVGFAKGGNGLLARSITGNAVHAASDSGVGAAGTTNSSSQSAVFGFNGATGQQIPDGLNRPAGNGVWGHTRVEKGSGVVGSVDSNLSQAAGVVGIGSTAGRFFGNV